MKKLIYLLAVITLTASCKKNEGEECPDKNEDLGLIFSGVDFGSCIYNLNENNFIVRDSVEYVLLQEKINEGKIGDEECTFPEINFDEYSLLGQYAQASGCTVNFNRNVEVDSTAKQIDYIISPIGCGECDMLGFSYNFVLVSPKISEDYQIFFNGSSKQP
ncbi:MAG: hypothetical protein ABFR62_06230 [Bacteroidota bacterium]